MSVRNTLFQQYKAVADYLTPVSHTSHFLQEGTITPEEFVAAGDQLINTCRSWQWQAAPTTASASPNNSLSRPYLPADKQYLLTRNVPSRQRATMYVQKGNDEVTVEQGDSSSGGSGDAEGWLSTHVQADYSQAVDSSSAISGTAQPSSSVSQLEQRLEGTSLQADNAQPDSASSAAPTQPTATATTSLQQDDEEEIPDMESFDVPVQRSQQQQQQQSMSSSSSSSSTTDYDAAPSFITSNTYLRAEEPVDSIIRTRTYDLSIVYDKYYRTPRIFLFGYDEYRQPLTAEQIMDDVSSDYANKTVTVEVHPYTQLPTASIHPCKHASVMKRLVSQLMESNERERQMDVRHYLLLFLKFISSVVPTIEYDFLPSTIR